MAEDMNVKAMSLGQRIRLVRGKRTQAEFGLSIGKRRDTIVRYEANVDVPSFLTLSMIAGMGSVTIDWLLNG